jgi:hypothetical protein
MSVPIADTPRSAPIAGPARNLAGAGTIIGIAFILMLVAVLAAFLIVSRGGPIDGVAELESAFGVRSVGAEYAVVAARKTPNGSRLVVFEDTQAPAEPDRARTAEKADDSAPSGTSAAARKDETGKDGTGSEVAAAKEEGDKVDWTKVAIPAAKARPRRVTFLFPEEGIGHEVVDSFFRGVERRSLSELGPEGGKVVITSGKLGWRGFDADWVHERAFERGGTFRDGISVDLSLEKRPCVMTAHWTRGEPASRIALDQLLESLGSE